MKAACRLVAIVASVLAAALGTTLVASAPVAERKVLVVSSNVAVPKFRQVEESFAAAFEGKLSRVDLGPEADADARVRSAMLAEKPDAVFCVGSRACLATAQATRRAPIVVSSAINVQRLTGADNVYGIASEMPVDYQLTTFRHLFPSIRRIGLLHSQRFNEETARDAAEAGRDAGIEIVASAVHRPSEALEAARELLGRVDALWVLPDPIVLASEANARGILELAHRARVPVLSYDDSFVELGALLSMTSDQSTIGTQAALMMEDIVSGRPPARRVIAPGGSQIVVNARALADYGIALSREAVPAVNRFVK